MRGLPRPRGAHVKAGGGKATIVAFSELQPKQFWTIACAAREDAIARQTSDACPIRKTTCLHQLPLDPQIAGAEIPAGQRAAELCYGCHADVRSQFSMPFKHRVNEGVMTCTDCHNPHGPFRRTWRMGKAAHDGSGLANEEPCLKCHVEKRGRLYTSILRYAWRAARPAIIRTVPLIQGYCGGPVVFTMCSGMP